MVRFESLQPSNLPNEPAGVSVPFDTTRPVDPPVEFAQLSDIGRRRSINEDSVGAFVPPNPQLLKDKGILLVVADGMGGHDAGEIASQTAVQTAINVYYNSPSLDPVENLRSCVDAANTAINESAEEADSKSGMGTTMIVAVLKQNRLYLANVGDSRAYLVRNGIPEQISEDHSWVQEQIRAGKLSQEDLLTHPRRNLITRALGLYPDVEIDLFQRSVHEDDVIVLCTDGLWGQVNGDEIAETVINRPAKEAARVLVDTANERGGPDNISVTILRVPNLPAPSPEAASTQTIPETLRLGERASDSVGNWWLRLAGIILLFGLFLAGALFLLM